MKNLALLGILLFELVLYGEVGLLELDTLSATPALET